MNLYRVLSEEDALKIRAAVLEMEWQPGQARTEYGNQHIKRNLSLVIKPEIRPIIATLQSAIMYNPTLQEEFLLYKVLPPLVNRYNVESPEFKRHGDSAFMMNEIRTDLSCTIFLTPEDEYDGGELCTETDGRIKGPPGTAVIYDGGQPHWVTPVTRGERISAVTWMQSYIRDAKQRKLLYDLGSISKTLEHRRDEFEDEFTSLGIIKSNLIRMWMEQ